MRRVVVLLLLVAACGPSAMSSSDATTDAPLCGNGVLDPGEACDTGGDTSGCVACAFVGDDAGEDAGDDGGVDAGEDASVDAGEDAGADAGEAACGDGALDAGEECDTGGDTTACVGCVVTDGYSCTGAPSMCTSAPNATVTVATVSEAGLPNGTTPSATTEVATGTLVVDYGLDGPGSVAWSAGVTSSSALTSGGTPITFALEGSDLVGRAGPSEALRLAGDFTVTLSRAFDHAGALVLQVPYIVTDADGTSVTSRLDLTITDDGPQQNVVSLTREGAGEAVNLLLMVQVSGGMSVASGLTGVSRLDLARAFIEELFARQASTSRVRIVTFSTNATTIGSTWLTLEEAAAVIDSLSPSGNTNFDAAVVNAQSAFSTPGRLVDAFSQAHFISNGVPNVGDSPGSVGIIGAEITAWQNFLSMDGIDGFAWAMGSGAETSTLDALAYDGVENIDRNATLVLTPWSEAVTSALTRPIYGNVYSGTFGADGPGELAALAIDGSTYTFDRASSTIAVTGIDRGTYDAVTGTLWVSTLAGGALTLNMITGELAYLAPASVEESATITVRDRDGTTASNALSLLFGDRALPLIVRGRRILSNISGTNQTFGVSLGALTANDSPESYTVALGTATSLSASLNATTLFLTDANTDGGSVHLTCTAGPESRTKRITLERTQAGQTTLHGTGLDEILLGRPAAADTLHGYEGRDWLEGGGGNDTIHGGADDDVIVGGSGNDTLTGGAGRDRFLCALPTDGNDAITDFVPGEDVVDLRAFFEASGVPPAARAARVQISGTSPTLVAIDFAGNGMFTTVFTVTGSGELVVGVDVIVQ